MRSPDLLLLTYLAQVRQLPSKNAWLAIHPVYTMRRSLHTPLRGKYGVLHRGIATIGTVRAVDWDALNKNMGVWLRDVESWQKLTCFTL